MHSLLQRGIGYRNDSKDDNRFICNLLLYKEYVAHKMVTTSTHLSTYICQYRVLSLPSSCKGGLAPLAPPIPTPLMHSG